MFDYPAFAALIRAKRGESRISQETLATDALGDPARKSDISRFENGRKKPNETTIGKLCAALEIGEAEMAPIRNPASVSEQFENLSTLTQEQLQNLAARFGIENPFDTSPAELRRLLKLKADEYRALKAEVDAIDDGLKRLSNLKAAARDAIDRGDLDEVEAMLQRVQEVELDEAAKTAELRARNALLRGRVNQAYTLLSAAADSFAPVDPVEPARRLNRFEDLFYLHAMRFSPSELVLSEKMARKAAELAQVHKSQDVLGHAYHNVAKSLMFQVSVKQSHNNLATINEAISLCQMAIEFRGTSDPIECAKTKNNLGIALDEKARLVRGIESIKAGEDAIIAYRDALTVRTRDDHPVDWAMTQHNLATALKDQGIRTGAAEGSALLAEAVTACRDAQTVFTRYDHSVEWAMTQIHLAAILYVRGVRTGGTEGAALLAEAVAACRDALTVYTRDEHPVGWAMTRETMAITELAIAGHDATPDPAPHLRAALDHVEAALQVYDPEHMSLRHVAATALRDRITQAFADL